MAFKLWHVPLRVAAGAYILNSGLQKQGATKETAARYHEAAATAYPQFEEIEPAQLTAALSASEIVLGTGLLLPTVSTALAGIGLTTFSGALLGLYWRTPGLHKEGDPRPTKEGLPFAKDSWLFAIGLALLIDAITPHRR